MPRLHGGATPEAPARGNRDLVRQNQEDVLLARALSDTDCGFYIDVGAGDPTEHSVTRHFYDLGWHGINVEPQPIYADRLRQARPRNVTLEVALSDHTPAGTSVSSESAVQLSTLAEVCSEPCADGDDISFLKMDVDGHEAAAVAGADWMRWMPRVAGDRGHRALERSSDSRALGTHALGRRIRFRAVDGLNRWFAQGDDSELIRRLSLPVNAFDGYEPYTWVARVAALEAEVASLSDVVARANALMARDELILALESLRSDYERLSTALDAALAQRAIDSDQVRELTAKVSGLVDQPTA